MEGANWVPVTRLIFAAPFFLKFQEDIGEAGDGDRFPVIFVAQLEVLAEDTAQGAAGEKTVPLPVVPLIHGSSHICKAALAARSSCPAPQKPVEIVRSA